ncbi:MAG: hypothetical protein ACUVXJ_05575 [Phycisphaerae bacterium]
MTRAMKCCCLLVMAGLWACGCDDSSEHQTTPGLPPEDVAQPAAPTDSEPSSSESANSVESNIVILPETRSATKPSSADTRPEGPDPFQPLADARRGEWAAYKALNSQTLLYRVREVGITRVKTEVRVTLDGRLLGMPAEREDWRTADPLAWDPPTDGHRQTSRTTIRAAERDWDAVLYEDRWTEEGVKYVRRTWVSAAVPVFGIVRMELTGDGTVEARLELTEAGQTE